MSTDSLIGTIVADSYRIERLLGKGGMGAVYLAKHIRLPRQVAIKFLHKSAAAEPEAFARFRREAEITSSLHHPSILEVQDFNQLPDGTPYLVMEFLEGEDLDARLQRRGRLPLGETLAIVKAVGAGLQAAHKRQIVHRDLKPGNIFLVRVEQGDEVVEVPKILDFGISKIRQAQTSALKQTRDHQLLGTPIYMSPEQARGDNTSVDERTDQWALAVIVYECLAGAPPFLAGELTGILVKIIAETPKPLQSLGVEVPAAIEQALLRALSKEREARFPSIAEFVKALGASTVTIDAMPPPPTAAPAAQESQSERRSSPNWRALPATVDGPAAISPAVAEASRNAAGGGVMVAAEIPVEAPRAVPEEGPSQPVITEPSAELAAEPPAVQTARRDSGRDLQVGKRRPYGLLAIPLLLAVLGGGVYGVRLWRKLPATESAEVAEQRRMAEQILATDKSPAGIEAAIRMLLAVQQKQPGADVELLLSQAYESKKDRGQALVYLRAAVEHAQTMTDRARYELALAQLMTRQGNTKEACQVLHMLKREVGQNGGELVTSAQLLAAAIACDLR